MLIKIFIILLILSPICNGITYLFVSNHPTMPYRKVAKYQDLENYQYKNKQAGIVYIVLGGIIGAFLLILNICFHFFSNLPPYTVIALHVILIILTEQVLCDTILNVRFTLDEIDEENSKNKE